MHNCQPSSHAYSQWRSHILPYILFICKYPYLPTFKLPRKYPEGTTLRKCRAQNFTAPGTSVHPKRGSFLNKLNSFNRSPIELSGVVRVKVVRGMGSIVCVAYWSSLHWGYKKQCTRIINYLRTCVLSTSSLEKVRLDCKFALRYYTMM